jgi:hypothetical protein
MRSGRKYYRVIICPMVNYIPAKIDYFQINHFATIGLLLIPRKNKVEEP